MVEKVRQKNHSRKSAEKNRSKKIAATKSQQQKRGNRMLQEEKCMVFICVVLNI